MLQDPLTLYKLIVLYMLNRVTFPLTAAQVSDFILGKEYTNFLTLQQVINELTDAGMIATQSIRNRTHLSITPEGKETLNFFENRIGDTIKQEIDTYFRENEFTLRNEVSVLGDYYKSTSGEYEAHLVAKRPRYQSGGHHIIRSRGRNCGCYLRQLAEKKSGNIQIPDYGVVLIPQSGT